MRILLTGASGMLGGYLHPLLKEDDEVETLQRDRADICCDLKTDIPDLNGRIYGLVVHCAGTTDDTDAIALNFEGTKRLIKALEGNPPREFVYVSSWEVYSPDAGEGVTEDHMLWAVSKTGQSKALAEDCLARWCSDHGVLLTVVRPARMFGKGMKGEMARLFDEVVNGRYIHVRGNASRISIVCATDVADAIKKLHSIGGIYNVTDGKDTTWLELAEAMSANSGAMKRQITLPEKWADAAWKLTPWIPAVKSSLSPETMAYRRKSLTLSVSAIRKTLPDWNPYPALEVISRQNTSYPYID